MIDQLVGHLCEEHSGFHEHLMSALLAIVSEHPRSVSECLRPELRTIELLKGRQQELKGKDAYRVGLMSSLKAVADLVEVHLTRLRDIWFTFLYENFRKNR